MKILHVSCVRQLSPGQRKQLTYEYEASKHMQNVVWSVVALTCQKPLSHFERQIPFLFRSIFLRNLYGWIYMLNKRDRYDYIICRHMVFDFFSVLFSFLIKNRITVHHAKEVQELRLVRRGIKGKLASLFEDKVGRLGLLHVAAIMGVTDEIRLHELQRVGKDKLNAVYPNAINTSEVPILKDMRALDEINAVFICGKFSSWHGLELLLESAQSISVDTPIRIHLIGELLDSQVKTIQSQKKLSDIFVMHGLLDFCEYQTILEKCDIGLASFALDKKGLSEASTLKVREYLALGLPVYSGHHDRYVENGSGFYLKGDASISSIIKFATLSKSFPRETVRLAMKKFIDKQIIMEKTVNWLSSFRAP